MIHRLRAHVEKKEGKAVILTPIVYVRDMDASLAFSERNGLAIHVNQHD
jgi:hypothetical protein